MLARRGALCLSSMTALRSAAVASERLHFVGLRSFAAAANAADKEQQKVVEVFRGPSLSTAKLLGYGSGAQLAGSLLLAYALQSGEHFSVGRSLLAITLTTASIGVVALARFYINRQVTGLWVVNDNEVKVETLSYPFGRRTMTIPISAFNVALPNVDGEFLKLHARTSMPQLLINVKEKPTTVFIDLRGTVVNEGELLRILNGEEKGVEKMTENKTEDKTETQQ